jgi:hypothetical protein
MKQVLRLLDDAKAGKTLGLNSLVGSKRVNAVSPFHSSTVSLLIEKTVAGCSIYLIAFLKLMNHPPFR